MIENDGMKETVAAFQYYVEGVGILAVGSVGVVINIVALYILFRKQVSFVSKNSSCIVCTILDKLCFYDIPAKLVCSKLGD